MNSRIALRVVLSLLAVLGCAAAQGTVEVVGYYPSWAIHLPYAPEDVDWQRVTHVQHAFLEVLPDATLHEPADYAATRVALLVEAQAYGVPVLASVGGWAGCTGSRIQQIAADPTLRATLVQNLADYCAAHGYAGVSLDWEFPGMAYGPEPACAKLGKDAAMCAADRATFTALSNEIRARFDQHDPPLRLSVALPLSAWFGECYDATAIGSTYDRLEIMAYDMHGNWSGHAGHNAQLHEPSSDPHGGVLSVEGAVNYWNVSRSVDAGRLLLGLPFFGYEYPDACARGDANVSGASQRPYSELDALIDRGWTRDFDAEASVPFLDRDGACGIVSYDDQVSLAAKTDFAVARGLAGFMIWDLSQDYLQESDEQPLLAAVANPFCTPDVVQGLSLARSGSDAMINWVGTSGRGAVYDVISGSIDGLRGTASPVGCLVDDEPSTQAVDSRMPRGDGFFYLVRAQSACGSGSYGRPFADEQPGCN